MMRQTERQRRGRAGGSGAPPRRPAQSAGSPAVLGLAAAPGNSLRSLRSLRSDTPGASQMRGTRLRSVQAASPALLGASEAHHDPLPARAFAASSSPRPSVGGLRGRRHPAGAKWRAASSAGPGSARAQHAHPHLTRRTCLSVESEANAASCSARPWTEQRSGVGAQRRPPGSEPRPGAACRDARSTRAGSQHTSKAQRC